MTSGFEPYFRTLNGYYREQFGTQVRRIAIRAESTCPDPGRCSYCSSDNLIPPGYKPGMTVGEQLTAGLTRIRNKYRSTVTFIAYFQDHTFTYRPIQEMEQLIEPVFSFPECRGIAIGTRPDCLGPDVLAWLSALQQRIYLEVELGLQSSHDRTLTLINRRHTVADFSVSCRRLADIGIPVICHIILGLPGETRADMLATADFINALPVHGIKFHNLHILKNTPLAEQFQQNRINVMNRDEYIDILIEFLGRMRRDIVVYRLMGETAPELTLAPSWIHDKSRFNELLLARLVGDKHG